MHLKKYFVFCIAVDNMKFSLTNIHFYEQINNILPYSLLSNTNSYEKQNSLFLVTAPIRDFLTALSNTFIRRKAGFFCVLNVGFPV